MIEIDTLVTIHCLTYNHEPYIRQCLEGFVMQQTNFKFEAIVHDDASTDGTAVIIAEFAEKYPDIIKPIYQIENQYSKKNGVIRRVLNEHTRGKYIAMCEGDDYWTDPLKLQKQVDFLEANPEYSLCCHRYKIFNEDTKTWDEDYGNKFFVDGKDGLSFSNKENFDCWLTKTLTLMYRKDIFDSSILQKYKYSRDAHLSYHLLNLGIGYCMNYNAGVYRRHGGGVFSSLTSDKIVRDNYKIHKELLDHNSSDIILQQYFQSIQNAFFDRIRNKIKDREFSSELKNDLRMYLIDIYKAEGLKGLVMRFKKILLSYKYGLN